MRHRGGAGRWTPNEAVTPSVRQYASPRPRSRGTGISDHHHMGMASLFGEAGAILTQPSSPGGSGQPTGSGRVIGSTSSALSLPTLPTARLTGW